MRSPAISVLALLLVTAALVFPAVSGAKEPEWSMNATVIEACSCPMFCQCYFNPGPAGHGGHEGHGAEHFCKFNNAYKINKGAYGSTKLDGAKFWIYGDLGGDFSKGHMDWAVVTFDKATTKPQRDAIAVICSHLFPVKWNSLTTGVGAIEWKPGADYAHALLDGGKTAEVRLQKGGFGMTSDEVVIKNLKYWGAPRNEGFVLMPNVIESMNVGPKAYKFEGTNGFMITIDIDSKTAPPAAGGSGM